MGEPRAGRKLVISGDTGPCEMTRLAAHEAQLLVHDASFADEEVERARGDRALDRPPGGRARRRRPRSQMLALVHVSSRYDVRAVLDEAREAFPAAIAPRDFDLVEIPFPERGEPRLVEGGARGRERTGPRRCWMSASPATCTSSRFATATCTPSTSRTCSSRPRRSRPCSRAPTTATSPSPSWPSRATLGLGTLNALDGEMIALDGRFFRADVDGFVEEIDPNERTPFAAVTWFEASLERTIERPLDYRGLLADLDTRRPPTRTRRARCESTASSSRCGRDRFRASCRPTAPSPRSSPTSTCSSSARSRAPWSASASPTTPKASRSAATTSTSSPPTETSGGHVLDCRLQGGTARIDLSGELHVELPPGIELDAPEVDEATKAAIDAIERDG